MYLSQNQIFADDYVKACYFIDQLFYFFAGSLAKCLENPAYAIPRQMQYICSLLLDIKSFHVDFLVYYQTLTAFTLTFLLFKHKRMAGCVFHLYLVCMSTGGSPQRADARKQVGYVATTSSGHSRGYRKWLAGKGLA